MAKKFKMPRFMIVSYNPKTSRYAESITDARKIAYKEHPGEIVFKSEIFEYQPNKNGHEWRLIEYVDFNSLQRKKPFDLMCFNTNGGYILHRNGRLGKKVVE